MKKSILILGFLVLSAILFDGGKAVAAANINEYQNMLSNGAELLYQSNYSSAIPYLERAYSIYDTEGESGETNQAALGLEVCYRNLRDFEKAFKYGLEYQNSIKKVLGKATKEYLDRYGYLAYYQLSLKQFDKALELTNECLQLTEELYGKETVEYSEALKTKAMVYQATATDYSSRQDYYNAMTNGEKALELYAQCEGMESLSYAIMLDNLGKYYNEVGAFEKGYMASLTVLPIFKNVCGEKSMDYLIALSNYAGSCDRMGKTREAIDISHTMLELAEEILGKDWMGIYVVKDNLANYYLKLENKEEAIKYRKETFDYWNANRGDYPTDWLICASNFMIDLFSMEKYAEAKEIGEIVMTDPLFEIVKKQSSGQDIIALMIDIYQKTNEPEKAHELMKKLFQ